jgi:glycosyltransferase involved in cell wall biosynthesis
MSIPVYSIIIPVYNRRELIAKVVNNILQQSFANFEVIVVNDGSNDGTGEELGKITDPRVMVINQTNCGVIKARKKGASLARGEWIAFCDSDDFWPQDYLAKCHAIGANTPAECIVTNYWVEGENQARITGVEAEKWLSNHTQTSGVIEPLALSWVQMKKPFYHALLEWQPVFTSTFMLTRQWYNDIGGICEDLLFDASEDSHLLRRVAATKATFVYLPDVVVSVGRQGDNLSASYLNNLIGGRYILQRMIDEHEIDESFWPATRDEIAEHDALIVSQAYWNGQYDMARKYYALLPKNKRNTMVKKHRLASVIKSLFKR